MAVLDEQDRIELWRTFMQRLDGSTPLTKHEIKNAVDAVDNWLDQVDSSIRQALLEPARSTLTEQQVRGLFMLVLNVRHGSVTNV